LPGAERVFRRGLVARDIGELWDGLRLTIPPEITRESAGAVAAQKRYFETLERVRAGQDDVPRAGEDENPFQRQHQQEEPERPIPKQSPGARGEYQFAHSNRQRGDDRARPENRQPPQRISGKQRGWRRYARQKRLGPGVHVAQCNRPARRV